MRDRSLGPRLPYLRRGRDHNLTWLALGPLPLSNRGDESGYTLYLLSLLSNEALPLAYVQRRPSPVREWRPWFRRPSALPSLDLHKVKRSQSIQRLPVTRLAPPHLEALHGLNYLSHELRDGLRLIILAYVELEVVSSPPLGGHGLPEGFRMGFPLFQSGTSPQPNSWCKKRKSYFQCFTFDFFLMVVMKLGLLLKQYHPKSPVSLGAL
ncbi:hypothetical protein Cgig2_026216 [Carnegiea gigantea]|uniref:Uncharacterized protein n=1 Tax=Carnegiea gigantea TaxID=171969 RepID=A0A9Q1QIU8_9CARY|nr:hypothetical protein Cgig2_026216 [Carnegiea gigantea]